MALGALFAFRTISMSKAESVETSVERAVGARLGRRMRSVGFGLANTFSAPSKIMENDVPHVLTFLEGARAGSDSLLLRLASMQEPLWNTLGFSNGEKGRMSAAIPPMATITLAAVIPSWNFE